MTDNFGIGQQTPSSTSNPFNTASFLIDQAIGRLSTAKIVQVKAVHSLGEVAKAGTVDVQPMVNQVDGAGNPVAHGTVYGVPWWRGQGSKNGVICDPSVGDVGMVVVCDRDISNVKKTGKVANPGSFRRFSLADGVYVGALLGGAPEQYVLLADGKIKIADKNGNIVLLDSNGISLTDKTGNTIVMSAAGISLTSATLIEFNGPLHFNGLATGPGNIVDFGSSEIKTTGAADVGSLNSTGNAVIDGKSFITHAHTGVQTGGGNTGPPV